MYRVNIGCGQTPTPGYRNFDNSLSLRFSKYPFIVRLLCKIGLIGKSQLDFIQFCQQNSIEYADAKRRLPLPDASVEVLYSSHMIEHLDKVEARLFLNEAKRVLCKGGVIRLCVPDLRIQVERYLQSTNADKFVADTGLAYTKPRTIAQALWMLIAGFRNHLWMYDGYSLARLMESCGFVNPVVLKPGDTRIQDHGNLDLYEKASQSVYVEANSS